MTKTGIDKETFIKLFYVVQRSKNVLIHNCYNDLFSGAVHSGIVINLIFLDTGIKITRDMVYRIKKQFDTIEIKYNPLWRSEIISQTGDINKEKTTYKLSEIIEINKNNPPIKQENKDENEIDLTLFDVTESRFGTLILPKNYSRKPNPHTELKYHNSLKNYIFPYPWKELDPLGIPYPAEVGEDEHDRDRFFLDLMEYDKIKENYKIPKQWNDFMTRHSSLFNKYRKSGIPSSKGGFNPDPEIDNQIV